MPNPQTTHSDRVAGWSIIGLFVLGVTCVIVGAYTPHLDAAGRTALFVIAGNCGGAVGGSLIPRSSNPQPADPPKM